MRRELIYKNIVEMHKNLLVPDLTMIFDLPARTAFERRKGEGATDVFELDLSFQTKLRKKYLGLRQMLKNENIVLIDSSRSPERIFADVKRYIDRLLRL